MDPHKFSAIAHRDHDFCNPIGPGKIEALLELVPLAAPARVLDLGCGNGALALRILARSGAQVTGVDRSPRMLERARARAQAMGPSATLTLVEQDIATFAATPESFDLVAMLGAGGLEGGVRGALGVLARWTRPGGHVLLGEGYWRGAPHPDYLALLGATADDLLEHAGNVRAGIEAGLVPLHALTASIDEWDDYEWRYARSVERYAREAPGDPDVAAMLERIRRWRDGYLRWGRDTLGFGCYLFLKP